MTVVIAALLLTAGGLQPVEKAEAVTPNGRLQIIHLNVAQGDGAVIISPLGQVVMVDVGGSSLITGQLQALGVTHVDYHFASHYHSDHIGYFATVFGAISLDYGWDRGGSYTTQAYSRYVNTLGARRRTLVKNQVITLDSLSAHPVTIKCVDLNGAGVGGDENGLSVVIKVSYGEFDEVFGGDLQDDQEPIVGPEVGPVEAYKVHHHGSAYSSTTSWLNATQPTIGVISVGPNGYGHPTAAALGRLHAAGVYTYWTQLGAGVAPDPAWDCVANGQVMISATWEGGGVDTVRTTSGCMRTFTNSGTAVDVTPPVVAVTAPDGGEDWKAGSVHTISWTATDDVGVSSVDLAYSTDGGASFPNVIDTGLENSGTYEWTVPNDPGTMTRVRVRAFDEAGNVGSDSSAADFAISTWTILASAGPGGSVVPSGAVPVVEGASQQFSIVPDPGRRVDTLLVDGSPVIPAATYTFTNVTDNHTLAVTFRYVIPCMVIVTSPVGGEHWDAGSEHAITWAASGDGGVDSINLDYSVTGPGGPWLELAHGVDNLGSFLWTLPEEPSDSALVRVTAFDHAGQQGSDESDAMFYIETHSVAVGEPGKAVLALARPQPNPAWGTTLISFSLPQAGWARLEILDVSGRRLWQIEGPFPAGPQRRRWDGNVTSGGRAGDGIYFVRLVTPWGSRTERLVWLH